MRLALSRAIAATLLLLSGCTEQSVLEPSEPVDSLIITTTTSTIITGGGVQLGLLVFGVSGQFVTGNSVAWTSDNPSVAVVNSQGFVVGVSPGAVTIRATVGGKQNSIVMIVLLAGCNAANGDTASIGAEVSGELTTKPCFLSGGYTAYGHILRVTEAGSIQLDLTGSGFFPTLLLTTATGGGRRTAQSSDGRTASLRASVLPGTYIIWAATLGAVTPPGAYTIRVASAAGDCTPNLPSRLTIGEARAVLLSTQSCRLLNGPVVEGWRLNVTEPTRVRFVAASADFPPMVALTDDELAVISYFEADNPGRAELNWLLAPGEYRLWAGSNQSSAGDFDVSLEEVEICAATAALALGEVVNGTFAAGDCEYDPWADRFADAYVLTLPAPTTVQFDLSGSVDPILFVTTLDGALLGQDDDSGDGLNARLVINLPAGAYRVWATSYTRGVTGSYTLSTSVPAGALQAERAAPGTASSRSEKPARLRQPQSWPARRTDGTGRR